MVLPLWLNLVSYKIWYWKVPGEQISGMGSLNWFSSLDLKASVVSSPVVKGILVGHCEK